MKEALLVAVVAAPLIACVACLLLARRCPTACAALAIAGNVAALLALLALGGASFEARGEWAFAGGIPLDVGLRLDALSRFMAFLVLGIALPVQVYALGDLGAARSRGWFFALISFFLGAMLALALARDFPLLFAAWEGIGLASCLLVGFHVQEAGAIGAALRVFLVTRVGDLGLLLAWLLAWRTTGTTDIAAFLDAARAGRFPPAAATLLAALFLWGAMGKSAQWPLAAWLPRAMAGPTPVSALIHSATLVASGVYLVTRIGPLYAAAPLALGAVASVGLASALLSALVASVQSDLKRVLAWSTSSQLGEMMFALGLGAPGAALLHLGCHATFKSALFLAAGDVQHAAGTRDLAGIHERPARFAFAAVAFAVAALALAGVPPFAGAWSEEAIAAAAARSGNWAIAAFLVLAALAGGYIGRAAWIVLRAGMRRQGRASRLSPSMAAATAALAAASVIVGAWLSAGITRWFGPLSQDASAGAAAAGAGIVGLVFGAWRGAAPARGVLGSWPRALEAALVRATEAPAGLARSVGALLEHCERAIDRGGARAVRAMDMLAARAARIERLVDRAALAPVLAMLRLARASDVAESRGFALAGNLFAARLAASSERLQAWESGRIYVYMATIFAWLAGAALLAVVSLALAGARS